MKRLDKNIFFKSIVSFQNLKISFFIEKLYKTNNPLINKKV